MKSLAAFALSVALLTPAAPSLAQPGHGRGMPQGRGTEPGREVGPRGGGEPRWNGGGRGGYGDPRGGFASPRTGYLEPRGGYYGPRAPYSEPRGVGYGYPGPPTGRGAPEAYGGWGGQQDEVRAGVRQGRYVGLARVIGTIRQRSPGHQLDAGLEQWGGRAVYRVRWAEAGGRRIDYIVDAQSGAILHVDGR